MAARRPQKAGKKAVRTPRTPRGSATSGRSPTVRWREVATQLAQDIRKGHLSEGDRLPKETELARRHGLSRHALRRALAELARLGLIEITPRVGARVAPARVVYVIDQRTRFTENVERAGRQPGARLLAASEGIAPPEIAALLEVARRTPVIELHTIRSANALPLALMHVWLPADRFARIAELFAASGSFTRAFAQLGVRDYRRRTTRITSRPATTAERRQLGLQPGATVLTTLALDVDMADEPIKVSQSVFAADRIELVIET